MIASYRAWPRNLIYGSFPDHVIVSEYKKINSSTLWSSGLQKYNYMKYFLTNYCTKYSRFTEMYIKKVSRMHKCNDIKMNNTMFSKPVLTCVKAEIRELRVKSPPVLLNSTVTLPTFSITVCSKTVI